MPACHAGGHESESRTHRQKVQDCTTGALVQLVRMPACHAGGHESESRTHRKPSRLFLKVFCFYKQHHYLSRIKNRVHISFLLRSLNIEPMITPLLYNRRI